MFTEGQTPRNFALSPKGNHLIVANQDSDNLMVFEVDPSTGHLSGPVYAEQTSKPVCIKFSHASRL